MPGRIEPDEQAKFRSLRYRPIAKHEVSKMIHLVRRARWPILGTVIITTGCLSVTTVSSVPTFPGAEGFGAYSVGGRGGRVIEVTNLNDSGPGSMRVAIESNSRRTVIFRVGGTVTLKSPLEITHPYITIAGQTAVGGGITLKNDPSNHRALIKIATHDVVIRHIRSRPGPSNRPSRTLDALSILAGYNIIIDHCSFSWATDEVLSTWYEPHDITIQWSIIAEGLYRSYHEEGSHGTGLLVGGRGRRISIHHNLLAHNRERNPRISTSGIVDVVNNVIYNPGPSTPSHITAYDIGKPRINYIGNYYKPGINSGSADYFVSTAHPAEIYLKGNYVPKDVIRARDQQWVVATRHSVPPVTTTSAQEAFNKTLAYAGATRPMRDPVDQRIVSDVRNGTGAIIDNPSEVGGWPKLANGVPPQDTDHDGMPDRWEAEHGLNQNSAADGSADADGNGYTNLEEYLNVLSVHF